MPRRTPPPPAESVSKTRLNIVGEIAYEFDEPLVRNEIVSLTIDFRVTDILDLRDQDQLFREIELKALRVARVDWVPGK